MIKVTVGEQKPQSEKPFPKLMIHVQNMQTIILALSVEGGYIEGVIINSHIDSHGTYSKQFVKCLFTDFNEPITLQNS